MTIQNKLFKAITSTFNESELQELKKYNHELFADFSGNGLNDGKLDVYFSKSIGAKNPNVVSALTNNPLDDLYKLYNFLDANLNSDFADLGFEFTTDHTNSFSFYVPIIRFQTKEESGYKGTYEAVIDVTFGFTDDRLTVVHTLYLHDVYNSDYIEIPYGWDLEQNDLTYILEDYLEIGNVISKKSTSEITNLMAFYTNSKFKDNQFIVDASTLIATHVSNYLFRVTSKRPKMLYDNMTPSDTHDTYHAYELRL